MVGAGRNVPTFIARQISILEKSGAEVKKFSELSSGHRWLRSKLCSFGISLHLPEEVKQQIRWADVVHFQWPGHYLVYGPVVRKFKKPVVLSLRGRQINIVPHLPNNSRYVKSLRAALPLCDGYHCVSRHILQEAEKFGLVASRARVITPAVDTSYFVPAATKPAAEPFRVAMVGALMWRKDYETALLAFRRVLDQRKDARLKIAGSGEDLERITYTIGDLGLEDSVELLGPLSPDGVRDLLQASHALLLTSMSEGIANVLLEAMSTGLPVVTTDAGGVDEAVAHGENGYVVPIRDFRAAGDYLLQLAASPDLQRSLGSRARARMVAEFDLQRQGPLFLELYERVLATPAVRH